MLHRLVYYSEKSENFRGLEDIRSLLRASAKNNPGRFVTGALYFDERYFLQILEGGRQEISQLYDHISKDPRHKNIVLVSMSTIAHRDFSGFSMLYLGEVNVSKDEILRFGSTYPLDPSRLSEANILELFKKLKRKEKGPGV